MIDLPILALLGIFIYRVGILDLSGSLVALLMAIIIRLSAGIKWLCLLLTFLFLGYLSTRYKLEEKKNLNLAESLDGRRTIVNVVANGAIPTAIALMYYGNSNDLLIAAYIGAIATVTGDTLSSEIGVLSKKKPRLITNLKEVNPGEDGAISILGEIAGIAGSLLIGISAYLLGFSSFKICLIASMVGGIFGFHLDSILGALFEREGKIGNSTVNFLSSLGGGIAGTLAVIRFC